MKCIIFAREVILLNKSVTFWIENSDNGYFIVRMSLLKNPCIDNCAHENDVLRWECYDDKKSSEKRLTEIFELLNKD
jgi:hypothetical protein